VIILFAASLGPTGIGVYPDLLFPMIWISPLLIIVSAQTVLNEKRHIFRSKKRRLEQCAIMGDRGDDMWIFLGDVELLQFCKMAI